MSDSLHHKLSDAIPKPGKGGEHPLEQGPPGASHDTTAEQLREAQEGRAAHEAQSGEKDRLNAIGKAGHMGGRGSGRQSDS